MTSCYTNTVTHANSLPKALFAGLAVYANVVHGVTILGTVSSCITRVDKYFAFMIEWSHFFVELEEQVEELSEQ